DGNYSLSGSGTGSITIDKASSTTTVTGGTFGYDGDPHGATVSVTGVGGLSLSPAASYTGGCSAAPVNVADTDPVACTASYSYSGDANHDGSSDSDTILITKAASTTTVTGGSFVYDGNPHGATVSVTGAGGLNLSPAPTYLGNCSGAPVSISDLPCTA